MKNCSHQPSGGAIQACSVSSGTQPTKEIYADYRSRKLDYCHFCGDNYNVGEKIPRILVHCGHTFCTECLSMLHHNFRVRCPICRKLIKNIETVERLPLNINILYEVVERDHNLNSIDFDDDSPEALETMLCHTHQERVKHFYCSNHQTIFCRECIKVAHIEEKCFVVDLYEIEKMRKLQTQNCTMNKNQLKKRKDGAGVSCVVVDTFEKRHVKPKIIQKKENKENIGMNQGKTAKVQLLATAQVPIANSIFAQLKTEPDNGEDFMAYDYENELATDEARTNEEAYEDIHQQQYPNKYFKNAVFPGGVDIYQEGKNCVLFNGNEDDENQSEGGSSEEEEGEEIQDYDEDDEQDDDEEEGEFIPIEGSLTLAVDG